MLNEHVKNSKSLIFIGVGLSALLNATEEEELQRFADRLGRGVRPLWHAV